MDIICPQNKCTGCNACVSGCPKNAISLVPDNCGYHYPHINQTLCIECGLCKKICPSLSPQPLQYPLDNIAAIITPDTELLSCASGGAATIFSRVIIENGGVVYGCDGTNSYNVHHRRISKINDVESLKGSKYVQSSIGEVYRQIREDLKRNCIVLFIGTPCQVAGLKGYLQGKNTEKLYTVDLVCHGVPSQKMLNDNIANYIEPGLESCKVFFRKKIKVKSKNKSEYAIKYGWYIHDNSNNLKNDIKITPFFKDPYMLGFISGLIIRPNCYECRYACIARCSDITVSDYWGLPANAGFDNGKGVSNILVNTNRGINLWNLSKVNFRYKHRDIVESICGNGQLQSPSRRHPQHDRFTELYPIIGFKKAVLKCCRRNSVIFYIKHFVELFKKL